MACRYNIDVASVLSPDLKARVKTIPSDAKVARGVGLGKIEC